MQAVMTLQGKEPTWAEAKRQLGERQQQCRKQINEAEISNSIKPDENRSCAVFLNREKFFLISPVVTVDLHHVIFELSVYKV